MRITTATICGALATSMLVAGIIGWAHWRFGSIANSISYVSGNPIQIDRSIEDLGTVKCAEEVKVKFHVTNLQDKPVELAGANASCSCILPPRMPLLLEPFKATPLTFTFTTPTEACLFEQEIVLYFNGPIPAMPITISGVCR